MNADNYSIASRPQGSEVVVTGPWSEQIGRHFESGEAERLVLNDALGFEEPDLEFLRGLPIRQLEVIDRRLSDLDPIYSLGSSLTSLSLVTDPSLSLDLNELPALTDLAADWEQVHRTLAVAGGLRRLYLGHYKADDLGPLGTMTELVDLTLKDRPRLRSLTGLAQPVMLQRLCISMAQRLEDTTALRQCTKLRELQLEKCRRLFRLDDIRACAELEFLNLGDCGDLESLEPLRGLTKLEVLYLYGTTRILNSDLSPVAHLPRLHDFRMQDRRTYNPSVADIQAAL